MNFNKTFSFFKLLTPTAGFADWVTKTGAGATVLSARLVYSWLVHRSRLGLGGSSRSICRELGLHPATVKKAIDSLVGLVERRDGRWVAVEPPEGLFVNRRTDQPIKHWSDPLAYSLLYLPRKGAKVVYSQKSTKFGLKHTLIWSHVVRRAGDSGILKGFTMTGAAALFDLDVKTVRSVVKDLLWLRLIEQYDLGGSSEIVPLPLTDAHLALFQQRPKPERKKVEPTEKKPRSTPAPYILKSDIWDSSRRLCDGLMPQSVAEAAIEKARRLGETPDDFLSEFQRVKGIHDQNIKSGKVAKGNFGKFLNTCYDNRVAVLVEEERKEREEERLVALLNSPEYKAKMAELQKVAEADPLHAHFKLTDEAILDRVRFHESPVQNLLKLDSARSRLHRHVGAFVATKRLPTQQEVDLTSNLKWKILKTALAALNGYYKQPALATQEQFERAVTEAIRNVDPAMPPLYPAR